MEEACQGSVGKKQLEGWPLMLPLQQWGTTEEWSTLRWFDRLLEVLLLLLLSRFSQSCLTLCDPIDGSSPGFPVPGILQARTLEWVAISFSSAWKWKVKVKSLSHVGLLATPWTAAYQAPLSTGFSRQEYWSGVPLPSPRQRWGREKSACILVLTWPTLFRGCYLPR